MESLPSEIINEILLRVDRPTVYYTSQVCNLWRCLSLNQIRAIACSTDFKHACKEGDRLAVIRSTFNRGRVNNGLYGACRGGNLDLIKLMMTKGANDWNGGLYSACQGGHKEIIELMIAKGAYDWNGGLYSACQGGHKEIVELMIAKGADDYNLYGGCRGGHKDIVELMILKGAKNLNDGLYGACIGDSKELIKLMILKGADRCSCDKSISEH